MIRACLFLLAGVYALQLSSFALDSDLLGIALLTFFVGMRLRAFRQLILVIAGAALFTIAARNVIDARIAPEYVGDSIVTQVRIVDFPKRNGATVSLVGESVDSPWVPRHVRISWYDPDTEIRLGDVWQLELRLRRPRGNSNPGVFDYEAWLLRERVAAVGYVVSSQRNQLVHRNGRSGIERIRQRAVDRIASVVHEDERAAVLAAISVGARHHVTPSQWQRYAITGTSHLMAISGLHVGLAAAGAYFLASLVIGVVWRRGPQHFVATVVAVAVAVAYAMISGFAVPAQRAAAMIVIAAAAILQRRQLQALPTIATACVLVILIAPLATMAPGFKLSFSAVLVLVWFARRYAGAADRGRLGRSWLVVRQLAAMQAMLLFGLLPLTVLIFDRIAIVAPVVNLIAVPIFSFVTVPATLAGLLLDGGLQPVGDQALLLAASSLGMIEMLIHSAAAWPGADLSIPSIAGIGWVAITMPLVWVLLPPGWPGRALAWIALIAIVAFEPPRPPQDCADIDVLDVGQGLSVVIQTREHTAVFDTGPSYRGGGSAAKSVVLPFLARRGIDRIDTLFVSHADLDHAGGVAAITSQTDIGEVYVGESLHTTVPGGGYCEAGQSWLHDGIAFDMIHPRAGAARDGNNASCVLMIRAGTHKVLLTGDIERPAEDELIRDSRLTAVDAVIVPHHGSRTSSSPPFVRALQPSLAIVSASFGNRWGFPQQDVVERWQAAGATVLATADSGAIGIRLCKQGGVVRLMRNRVRQRRIWHE